MEKSIEQSIQDLINERDTLKAKLAKTDGEPVKVKIVDLDIPFVQMIFLFVKIALAAVPAAILVGMIYLVIIAVMLGR